MSDTHAALFTAAGADRFALRTGDSLLGPPLAV